VCEIALILYAVAAWFASVGRTVDWENPPWAWICLAALVGMVLVKILERLGK
jgi:hypothetical protein